MKMVIVFANTDLMALSVISVQKDSQARNVMNANANTVEGPVTIVKMAITISLVVVLATVIRHTL